MPDSETPEVAAAKPKRGRPRKRRHDPDVSPIDGDYTDDVVLNKEPGFRYMWASPDDIGKVENRGGGICHRDSEQARPAFDRRRTTGEGAIVVKGLTLMKIREEDAVRAERPGLDVANRRMKGLRKEAVNRLGDGQHAIVSEDSYIGS